MRVTWTSNLVVIGSGPGIGAYQNPLGDLEDLNKLVLLLSRKQKMVEVGVYRICLGFGVKSSIAHGLRAQSLLCTVVLMEY